MKKSNKNLNKKEIRKKYKYHIKTAEDIFELNSPNGVNCLDSKLSNDINEIVSKFKNYNKISKNYTFGLLPYVINYLIQINNLKVKFSLKKNIQNDKLKCYFYDLLTFEEEFVNNDYVNNNNSEFIINELSNIKLLSIIPLINIELLIENMCTIDISFDLPEYIFENKDYINYIYFIKRACIIYEVYNRINTLINNPKNLSEINYSKINNYINQYLDIDLNNISVIPKDMINKIKVELEYLNDLKYVPIISIIFYLNSKIIVNNSMISICKFRIIPNLTNNSCINKDNILLYRNNVRRSVTNFDNWYNNIYDNNDNIISNKINNNLKNNVNNNNGINNDNNNNNNNMHVDNGIKNNNHHYLKNINSCFLPPTPQYNGALYNEFLNNNLYNKEIIDVILSSDLLQSTLILLKIWCFRWKLWNNMKDNNFLLIGQFNQDILLNIIYHCYILNKESILLKRISSFQFFKLILITLKQMILNWKYSESGIHYILGKSSSETFEKIFNNENDFKMTNLLHLFNRDYIDKQIFILFDKNYHNIFWRCQGIVKNELDYILIKTLNIIDNKLMINYNQSLYELFNINMNNNNNNNLSYNINDIPYNITLLEFDCCCIINYPNKYDNIQLSTNISDNNNQPKMIILNDYNSKYIHKRLFDKIWEDSKSSNLTDIIRRILKRSFNNRIKYMSLREVISRDEFGCLIGIKFTSETRLIDKGPEVNTIEAKYFREFWGNKVETRKFKDGRVLETILWEYNNHNNEFINNSGINENILKYILPKYLPDISLNDNNNNNNNNNTNDININNLNYNIIKYSITPFNSINSNINEKLIYEEFSNFKLKISNLTSLPLNIKTILTSSEILRFTKYYNIINEKNNELYMEEIPCIIEMEQSNKWPKTKESINKIKTAFLLLIKKELNELYSINSDIIPEYYDINSDIYGLCPFLDIYWSNHITFRISIFHPSELTKIANNIVNIDNISEKIIQNNIINKDIDIVQLRNLWWKTQITMKFMNLNNYFPSFKETIKKLKQFTSIHKIPDADELIEHIVAYIYTNNDLINNIYESPNTSTTGFIRSLWLLSNYEWNKKPLIVDINYQIDQNNNKNIIDINDYNKLDYIHSIYYNYIKKHNLKNNYFYISTLIDPQSILIKLPTYYNSHRLIYFARLYLQIITNNSFNISINKFQNLLFIKPKSDIIITLNADFNQLIKPKYKKYKSNILLKKQYINLNTTEYLLKNSNIRAYSSNISNELFMLLISDIKDIFNQQIDIIYDSYIFPYPNKIYLKFNPNYFHLNKLFDKNKYNYLHNCIININDNSLENSYIFTIPNIIQMIYYIWSNYNGFIVDIKFT